MSRSTYVSLIILASLVLALAVLIQAYGHDIASLRSRVELLEDEHMRILGSCTP